MTIRNGLATCAVAAGASVRNIIAQLDPMSPGPRLITEPPADAHIVDREKPNGSSSGSRCLLRLQGP